MAVYFKPEKRIKSSPVKKKNLQVLEKINMLSLFPVSILMPRENLEYQASFMDFEFNNYENWMCGLEKFLYVVLGKMSQVMSVIL